MLASSFSRCSAGSNLKRRYICSQQSTCSFKLPRVRSGSICASSQRRLQILFVISGLNLFSFTLTPISYAAWPVTSPIADQFWIIALSSAEAILQWDAK
jgi:hypothetical protein